MADEIYNPSTDNLEKKEEPRLNPSTGISNFVQQQKSSNILSETLRKVDADRKAELDKKQKLLEKKEMAISSSTKKSKITFGKVIGISSVGKLFTARSKRPIADKLKVLRLQNMLEKKRLMNQIEKFKLQKKVELLRKKGILKQTIAIPIMSMPQRLYPAYSTPEMQADIDSMYADTGHADNNLFGSENYYNERYYDEEYYDAELNLSPWAHLNISPKQGVSPLFW